MNTTGQTTTARICPRNHLLDTCRPQAPIAHVRNVGNTFKIILGMLVYCFFVRANEARALNVWTGCVKVLEHLGVCVYGMIHLQSRQSFTHEALLSRAVSLTWSDSAFALCWIVTLCMVHIGSYEGLMDSLVLLDHLYKQQSITKCVFESIVALSSKAKTILFFGSDTGGPTVWIFNVPIKFVQLDLIFYGHMVLCTHYCQRTHFLMLRMTLFQST